jgi:tetratricopeptide (TPR) repeat protein
VRSGEAYLAGGYAASAAERGRAGAEALGVAGWSLAARAGVQLGEPVSAIEAAQRWAEHAPDDAAAWATLGDALSLDRSGGRTASVAGVSTGIDAFGAFDRAAALDPASIAALARLGDLYESAGRWDEARGVYEQWVARRPGDSAAWRRLARAQTRVGEWAPAEAAYTRAATLADERGEAVPMVWYELGLVRSARGATAEAADAFARATAAEPGLAPAWLELARAQEAMGNASLAADAYSRATEASPDWLPAWLGLAGALADSGRARAAAAAVEEAERLCPGCAAVEQLRARVEAASGD